MSKVDLLDRFHEIVYLLEKPKKQLLSISQGQQARLTLEKIFNLQKKASALIAQLNNKLVTDNNLNLIITERNQAYQNLREIIKISSSISCLEEWQSPSFTNQIPKMSGSFTGKVLHTINDYKRDQHQIARNYEVKFIKEYYQSGILNTLSALTTSSGMSAFTLILSFLIHNGVEEIYIGKHSYFELKILTKILIGKIFEFDEQNYSIVKKIVSSNKTKAIIFDSISNDKDIFKTDIPELLSTLNQSAKKCFVVIDNTVASISVPIHTYIKKYSKLQILSFESLNKYHQFGLDLTTGGILYAKNTTIAKMHPLRMHLGVNSNDLSMFSLPDPNRKLLQNRMAVISRNATMIAKQINQNTSNKTPKAIVLNTNENLFNAPFFAFSFSSKTDTIAKYKLFCKKIYKMAKKQNLTIVGGSSFGLNQSRLYLTALRSSVAKPFVRFSPGTETALEINALGQFFAQHT